MNFTGRINAFRVIERLQRMNILGGQNTQSVNRLYKFSNINYNPPNNYRSNWFCPFLTEKRRRLGVFRRVLAYPLALVLLLALTGTAVAIVGLNTLQLVVGIKTLPLAASSTPAILGEAQKGKVR